jgi:dienelactone hydrolase
MRVLPRLFLALAFATPLRAESATSAAITTDGWDCSGQVVGGAGGELLVRLELSVPRGSAALSRTVELAGLRAGVLAVDYRSTTTGSLRDRGAWAYLAYRDGQNKTVAEQAHLFAPAAAWTRAEIAVQVPAGATRLHLGIRQQQRVGVLDLRAVELRPAEAGAAPVLALGPVALAGLAWIQAPGPKLSPDGAAAPAGGDIFAPFLAGQAPAIVHELGSAERDGVQVRKLVFRSLLVGGETQDVYAIIARPAGAGRHPGLLSLHGGWWRADEDAAVRYAKAGYVTISPDLPGIADPGKCPHSAGPWAKRFAKRPWSVSPDPTADQTFDAVVAALQSFDLLAAQPGVDAQRIGVSGISMGGYSTTMVAGLLGRRVRAAYSKFGCGFYELGSEWSAGLANLPDDRRSLWLKHFDAGRRAPGIQAPYFIAAAVRDHFFWPPAVNATLLAVPAGANQAYAHVITHRLEGIPGEADLDLLYFAHHLKGEGQPFPRVAVDSCTAQADGSRRVTFTVQAPLPVQTATLYLTAGGDTWESSTWEPIAAQAAGPARFEAVIPAGKITATGAWYVNVSDARPATAGSLVYGLAATGSGAALVPLGR